MSFLGQEQELENKEEQQVEVDRYLFIYFWPGLLETAKDRLVSSQFP